MPFDFSSDTLARERALAVEQSFIVRAPAGSGKTDLLTRRFLKLLATAEEPEEVLAITFTRAATAEMRGRVLGWLEQAARGAAADEDERVLLARAALARSEAQGWRLLEQPDRLNIETIDSLCLRIAQNQPLLSRMGGSLSPTENAGPLYASAAQRTLERLGSAEPQVEEALGHLLELRDNNLADSERLIAGMLAQRDQWLRAFPLVRRVDERDWERAREELERPFLEEVKRVHAKVYELMMRCPGAAEVLELARYACGNGNAELGPLMDLNVLPDAEAAAAEQWRCICRFLLTKEGEWRKPGGLNKSGGFPAGNGEEKQMKERMGELLRKLEQIPGLREALCAARDVPDPHYDALQWKTLRHLFVALRQAVAELRVLFAERETVDFTELNIAAREVLSNSEAGPDVLLALSGNIRHLLVDEFQDTSLSQHGLLCLLIRAWDKGDGRTCFFVGDPMQSIYLFRQAEVELFQHVAKNGLVSEEHTVNLQELDLQANFRSHEGLTQRWNEIFEAIFTPEGDSSGAQVRYSHTIAAEPALPGEAVHVYPQIVAQQGENGAADEGEAALEREAEQVVAILEQHRPWIERAIAEGKEYRVAVLARARQHLAKIVERLRARGIPFRAVDLEKLSERQELLDLLSLIRALLHPMDRIAWLSVLRAPWCGLSLEDLHALTGADDPAFRYLPIPELIVLRSAWLSRDGAARVQRTAAILKQALAVRFEGLHNHSFSQWIERTWRSLGGQKCVDENGYENVRVFFGLLNKLTPDGMFCLTDEFEAEMERLYAQPDPGVSERAGVQLMTIHKAKGLGFDVVIVPGLDRGTAHDNSPLICSLERTNAAGEREMLAAPIGFRGSDSHPTYRWVQKQRSLREEEELKRVLYVACTRARRSLHLLGTATSTGAGLKPGDAKSLLATAWPALRVDFERAEQEHQQEEGGRLIAFPSRAADGVGLDIAAGADASPEGARHPKLVLRRLTAGVDLSSTRGNVRFARPAEEMEEPAPMRPEGSRDARQKGSVVHALLEQASRGATEENLRVSARFLLRAMAYSGKALEDATAEVLVAVRNCVSDPDGAWILAPHPQAESESAWTSWREGKLEAVRADRVFLAGATPRAAGEDHLWIVDYKMSAPAGDANFIGHQRAVYAPQLNRYARVLRDAKGLDLPVRLGLYYPRIARLDWWDAEIS